MGKTDRSGLWLFRCALRRGDIFSSLLASCDWVKKGSYHTAWSVHPLSACSCSYAYGQGTAIRPHTGERCWSLVTGLWRAVAPLMKPWCAEGVLPTAANLNLYRGGFSRVAWHSDNEPLFGARGESKIIVSMSFGTRARFKWKGESCLDSEADSCWLDQFDLLVMDGQCQDEFLHCTDPGLEQERINVTFRWIKQHAASCSILRTGVACCFPKCAQGSSVSATEFVGTGAAWGLLVLLVVLLILGVLALLIHPLVCVGPELRRRASRWIRPSGGVQRRHCFRCSLGVYQITGKCAIIFDGIFCSTEYCLKLLYMLVLVKLPSLHDNYAYMVSWNKGALRGNCRQIHSKTSFSPVWRFLLCRNSLFRFWGCHLMVSLGRSG